MLNKIKDFFSWDSKTLQLGMDPQRYNNLASPEDIRALDIRDNKYHHNLVEDKVCTNLEQVFASNIFAKVLQKVIDSKKKEWKALSIETWSDPLISIIQKLHNKQDIFDGITLSHQEINTLGLFLWDISSEDMKHITEIYTKIAPKSWKRKDQQAMEAFVALTHPTHLKRQLDQSFDDKKSLFSIEKWNVSNYEEVQSYLRYLNWSEKSMKDTTQYANRKKQKLNSTKSKIWDHRVEVFNIIAENRLLGVYMIADNNPETLQYIWKHNDRSINTVVAGDAIIMNLYDNRNETTTIKIITPNNQQYEFWKLYRYKNSKWGKSIKYIWFNKYSSHIEDIQYFDENFNEITMETVSHSTMNGSNFVNKPTTHHNVTLKDPNWEEVEFTMIHRTTDNFISPDSECDFDSFNGGTYDRS